MKILRLIEEGRIAKSPQKLLNFVRDLAILLSKTTGFCLISTRVVRVLLVILAAIGIAILKISEKT